MNKLKLLFLLCLTVGVTLNANAETKDLFGKEVPLTDKERLAVQKAKEWIEGNNYPFRAGQKITYLYGQGQPVAVCAPLQLCMIELGKNERVSQNGIHLGDSVRWQVSPSIGAEKKTFLIIKPVDVGLSTSLAVVTDQASYNIKLISRLTDLTPLIAFHHPNAVANEWVDYYEKLDDDREKLKAKRAAAREKREQEKARKLAEKRAKYQAKQQMAALEKAQKRAEYQAKQKLAAIESKQRELEIKKKQQELALAKQKLEEQRRYEEEKTEARLRQAQQAREQRLQNQQNQQIRINQNRQNNQRPPAQPVKHQRSLSQANATGRSLDNLDFNYSISGCETCPWKPVRVYNNGSQTIIEMSGMSATEAPALLVLGESGQQLVNYRLKGKSYIVDQVFNAAMLVAGVGKRQSKIVIIRGGGES